MKNIFSSSMFACIFSCITVSTLISILGSSAVFAAESSQSPAEIELTKLLQQVNQDKSSEIKINKAREQRFIQEKSKQEARLKLLVEKERKADVLYQSLSAQVDTAKQQSITLKATLEERSHHLKDLYSVARQIARDTQIDLDNSLTSTQYPASSSDLDSLLQLDKLPQIVDLKSLWRVLLQDIKASAEVSTFKSAVFKTNGDKINTRVYRTGPFTANTQSHYLSFSSSDQRLNVLNRQPEGAENLISQGLASENTERGALIDVLIDPTRGSVLARLNREPSLLDRILQGGSVGFVIIFLGVAGLLYTLFRLITLSKINTQIKQQLKTPEQPDKNNPLGRVLAVYHDSATLKASNKQSKEASPSIQDNHEGLEIKLNEAILREAPKLDKGTGIIKLLATVAPLLGLLGTVTGMIGTFQAITLFGTGDPKLMAGGISQALITTVLGLIVAIPLLFGHSLVATRVKSLLTILTQQSLSLVAQTIEKPQLDTDK
ncbi:MAG: biopolymer transport protein ExbB [Oleiphilaceae bacterium]|jgi:biopolymer transport protein ExbB